MRLFKSLAIYVLAMAAALTPVLLNAKPVAPPTADPAICFTQYYSQKIQGVTYTHWQLAVINDDGSNRTVIYERVNNGVIRDPVWSSDLDGNPSNGFQGSIAFMIAENGNRNIYLLDVLVSGGVPIGTNVRLLVSSAVDPNALYLCDSPDWSPDLDPVTPGYQGKIAFAAGPTPPGTINLIDMAWNGATVEPVSGPNSSYVLATPGGGGNFHPTWSPDGSRIALQRLGINVIDSQSGQILTWIDPPYQVSYPRWSRTSSRVAFHYRTNPDFYYTMDVDQGLGSLLPAGGPSIPYTNPPSWSPDDTHLAFVNNAIPNGRKTTRGVQKLNLATGQVTVLVTDASRTFGGGDWRRF